MQKFANIRLYFFHLSYLLSGMFLGAALVACRVIFFLILFLNGFLGNYWQFLHLLQETSKIQAAGYLIL